MARLRKEDAAAERRTEHVGFYVTPTERARLERRAPSGQLSEWCRRRALLSDAEASAPAPAARDPEAIRGLRAEIAHVGNNWNQMTRHVNAGGDLPSRTTLDAIGAEIMAALRKVREL